MKQPNPQRRAACDGTHRSAIHIDANHLRAIDKQNQYRRKASFASSTSWRV